MVYLVKQWNIYAIDWHDMDSIFYIMLLFNWDKPVSIGQNKEYSEPLNLTGPHYLCLVQLGKMIVDQISSDCVGGSVLWPIVNIAVVAFVVETSDVGGFGDVAAFSDVI